jgi:hypothetical protein
MMSTFLHKLGRVAKYASGAAAVEGAVDAGKEIASSLSGRPQARAIRDAAEIQAASGDRAIKAIQGMHDQSRADLQPWVARGNEAGDQLSALFAPGGALTKTYGAPFQADPFTFDVNSDPGAQFRLDQANKAYERSAAGRSRSMGGRAAANLSEFNQQLASQEYGNAYDRYNADRTFGLNQYSTNRNFFNTDQGNLFARLFSLSGQGQASAAGQAAGNQATGASLADLFTGIGNAQAGSLVGQANAKASGAENVIKLLTQGGTLAAAFA